MITPADDLSGILFQIETGSPKDNSNGYSSESSRIDMLVDMIRGFEMGEYDINEVETAFQLHGPRNFDVRSWVAEQIAAAKYGTEALTPHGDEPEVLN